MVDISSFLSRFAFIFLIFAVVSSGYLRDILSCQMRYFLKNMYYAKHIFGILLVFVFIMLEGGWSFDKKEDDKAPTNWASGNVVDTLIISTMIYSAFIFTSKSKLFYNLAFFALAFTIYLINTQRQYWVDRKTITPQLDNQLIKTEVGLFGVALFTLFYGFFDYIQYQKSHHKKDFSWVTFFFGTSKCESLKKKENIRTLSPSF